MADQRLPPILSIEGFAGQFLEEVVKADTSMHAYQIAAWQHFQDNRPRGKGIPPDIHSGFAEQEFLRLQSLELQFSLRPQRRTFWRRLKVGLNVIFRPKYRILDYALEELELASQGEEKNIDVSIQLGRGSDGTLGVTSIRS